MKETKIMENKIFMLIKTYFWIEDRKEKSSYLFWKTFVDQLCPEVIVESKKNNSELVKAVKTLEDTENKYIVIFDNSFDNPQVIMERKLLLNYIKERSNVMLLDIICFEYILLEFKDLIQWIYAPNDEFLQKRVYALAAREKLIHIIEDENYDYKELKEIVSYCPCVSNYNIEQLSARLLFDLTRNTGFEVTKGTIGECWLISCCEWENREENDVCGLDQDRLYLVDKMKYIYKRTSLKKQFQKIGLEIVL